MFRAAPALTPDPLWAVVDRLRRDPRPGVLDLVVGVYRDDRGESPVQDAVHRAEARLLARNESKQYRGLRGDARFTGLLGDLVLGGAVPAERVTTIQTIAGTGALRLLADLVAATAPGRAVLLGTPAYANHEPILRTAGLEVRTHPHVTAEGALDLPSILGAVRGAAAGDVLLVQGCCHNPTGVSMTGAEWDALTDALLETGVVPFVDQAYYGLGDGLQEDLAGMRRMLARVPEALVAVSASKAFGLYSERTGCAIVVSGEREAAAVGTTLEAIARATYSQPPHHGAAIVAEILGDEGLRLSWMDELDGMRDRIAALRTGLTAHLAAAGEGDRFAGLAAQRGMFLTLPLAPGEMAALARDAGIYGLPSGRINLAGVPAQRVPELASALVAALAVEAAA